MRARFRARSRYAIQAEDSRVALLIALLRTIAKQNSKLLGFDAAMYSNCSNRKVVTPQLDVKDGCKYLCLLAVYNAVEYLWNNAVYLSPKMRAWGKKRR